MRIKTMEEMMATFEVSESLMSKGAKGRNKRGMSMRNKSTIARNLFKLELDSKADLDQYAENNGSE